MSDQQSIKDTLNIIRKALEDDDTLINQESNENILILNKLVNDDGTIEIIQNNSLQKDEIKDILDKNIKNYINKNFDKWLDKNISNHLEKHLKNKK
tara:strand:+ start:103 stop:390 length:288 start_codon:yes stop_codon:yes gene_type:complete